MAYDNTEVEIKLKLDDDQVGGVVSALKSVATFVKKSRHRDTYFVPSADNFLDEEYPYKWLSVRERDEDKILNFKHHYPEKAESHEYGKEYEVKIDNIENLTSIFRELNIVEAVIVEKTRDIYQYKDEYEVTVDKVAGLGYFMEIEAQRELGTPLETKAMMLSFVTGLGIANPNIDLRGYPFLLLHKRGDNT